MDRTAWIAVTLVVVGLMLWEIYSFKQIKPRPAGPAQSVAGASPIVTPSVTPAPTPTQTVMAASPAPTVTASVQPSPSIPAFAEVTETLRNSDVELHLTNRGGGIAEAVLLNHLAEQNKHITLNSGEHPPIGALVSDPAAPALPEYKITREGDAVVFESTAPEEVSIRKKFSFPSTKEKKDNYIALLDLEFRNGGASPYNNPGYFVELGAAAPVHRNDWSNYTRLVWCVDGKAKHVDVDWFNPSNGFFGFGQRLARSLYQEDLPGAEWAAVTDQFFTTLVAPLNGKANGVWGKRFDFPGWADAKVGGIEGAARMGGFKVDPGQSYVAQFQIYTGPKLYHRLATLPHNEAEVVEFGVFKIVCQTLLNALNTLHSWLGNYAAAIFALTVIVKAILWPLQNKATRSARQMSALSPKMQELREKYKDDPTKMNQELMKLYKEYGINPVGGCLPMVIQIPIFFGLFTMLRQAVELRNASFFWIHDLSQPDTVAHFLGFPINVLPLIMAATSFWMTHLTPKSGDPTQQRMMMFMPIIFIVFCYNFAAALALYYTTQNLLTILQLYLNKRQPMPTLQKVDRGAKGKR
jgi:YidC/Oxa1 family membrane protein insertase